MSLFSVLVYYQIPAKLMPFINYKLKISFIICLHLYNSMCVYTDMEFDSRSEQWVTSRKRTALKLLLHGNKVSPLLPAHFEFHRQMARPISGRGFFYERARLLPNRLQLTAVTETVALFPSVAPGVRILSGAWLAVCICCRSPPPPPPMWFPHWSPGCC